MTSQLELVYEKYEPLDGCLSDPEWCTSGEGAAIYAIARELWRAVKEARGQPTERIPNYHYCLHKEIRNGVEFCHFHDKEIHATLAEHDALIAAQARKEFAAAIVRERPDTMQATETMGGLNAWNGRTIIRLMDSLAQPEPKEREPE